MSPFLNAHAPIFYGGCVCLALLMTGLSGRVALIKTAGTLMGAWVACNLIVAANGHQQAPLLIPLTDAILCMGTLTIAVPARSGAGIAVACGYGAAIAIWCVALYTGSAATPLCYLAVNGVFFVQCMIGSGAGGLAYADSRRDRRDLRPVARPGRA